MLPIATGMAYASPQTTAIGSTEDIEGAEAEHGRVVVEKLHRNGDDRDGQHACCGAGQPEPKPCIHCVDNGTFAAWPGT